ncbi:MAG TPA: hypothetical protein VN256_16595 [Pyrinomonadaceae bacterium]|nr:hypothetical protein [Pyrinomonadaceae bacterium]
MAVSLINIQVPSVYKKNGNPVNLPSRMAKCTPDTRAALLGIRADLRAAGGDLVLSDLFRSYDMQLQSHLDYVKGKKTAFSPPPGGSLHEAGRACDLSLNKLKMTLKKFWPIAKKHGMLPIIATPNPGQDEAWHFDCRGSHDLVYKYYTQGKGTNMEPYTAMAASGILSVGIQVDRFGANQKAAAVQAALVRLGFTLGNIDGQIGQKTRDALTQAGVDFADPTVMLAALEQQLSQKFPEEFGVPSPDEFDMVVPPHVNV